jgi:hypothetical protein
MTAPHEDKRVDSRDGTERAGDNRGLESVIIKMTIQERELREHVINEHLSVCVTSGVMVSKLVALHPSHPTKEDKKYITNKSPRSDARWVR